jgi:dolichol-phosphate mannosyltransferase
MKVSVVVAVYQNEGTVAETHRRIQEVFRTSLERHTYELVFVDDGSRDGSLAELLRLHESDPAVKVVTLTRNFGQMAAMLAGFKEATGDAVINISADLQDPIELVPKMVEHWEAGAETVICYRTGRSDSLGSRVTSKIAYALLRRAQPEIPPGGFDVVLMDRRVMDAFNAIDVRHRYFQGDLLWTGYRLAFVPYERQARTVGRSQYNVGKRLKNFIDAILDASYLPIRLISLVGTLTAGLGFFWALSIVISWLAGDAPFTGWAPLMVAVLVVGGLIMLMLGMIGEYVWLINEEVRKRPNYIIRDRYL